MPTIPAPIPDRIPIDLHRLSCPIYRFLHKHFTDLVSLGRGTTAPVEWDERKPMLRQFSSRLHMFVLACDSRPVRATNRIVATLRRIAKDPEHFIANAENYDVETCESLFVEYMRLSPAHKFAVNDFWIGAGTLQADEVIKAAELAIVGYVEWRAEQKGREKKASGAPHNHVYNLGLVYQTLSRFDLALLNFKKALPIFEKPYGPDHPEVAQIHAAIGNVLSETGRNEEALPELEAALPVLQKTFGDHLRVVTALNNLGAALHGLNRNQEALVAYDEAIDIKTRISGPGDPDIAIDLVNRGNIYESLRRPDEAIAQTVRALALYGGSETRLDPIRKAYWGLARALDMKGEHRAAIIFAKKAVNAHQELRLRNEKLPADLRSSLAQGLRWVYQLVADQQIADGAYSEAQYAGSLIKEEELFDFTTRGSTGGPRPKGQIRLTVSEGRLIGDLVALLKGPRKLVAEAQKLAEKRRKKGTLSPKEQRRASALNGELDAAFAALSRDAMTLFANVEAERQAIQAEQLESNAKHGTELQKMLGEIAQPVALYQAIATDDALHLFITAKGRETIHRLVPVKRTELARRVFDAVESVEAHEEQAPKLLAGLYDLLIRPVAADIRASEVRVLMLNLSGFLRYVPYAALNSGDRYLVEDYALALYTPVAAPKFIAQPREELRAPALE